LASEKVKLLGIIESPARSHESSHRSVFHGCSTLHASVAVNCDKRRIKVAYGEDTGGSAAYQKVTMVLRNYYGCPKPPFWG
jgi:hypothetical protein